MRKKQLTVPSVAMLAFAIGCTQSTEPTRAAEETSTAPRFAVNPTGQDLTITKTPASQTVPLGTNLGFTITVTNGPAATNIAPNTLLTDQLPTIAGVTWSVATSSWGGGSCAVNATNLLTCGTGVGNPLVKNATFSVQVTGTATPDAAACGTYSNTATFHYGDASPQASVQSPTVSVTIECPPPPAGCTYTQGFWKTHSKYGPAPSDPGWNNLPNLDGDALTQGPDEKFYTSGKTWIGLWGVPPGKAGSLTPPRTNGYIQLAHQYMAAKLNLVNGAATTAAVTAAITGAENYFKNGGTLNSSWATTLGDYNEGKIGPGHCN